MSQKDDRAPKSPQERASEHLKKMLRSAAIGGAALGLSGGCGSCGPFVSDPMPEPICERNPTTGALLNNMNDSATWRQDDAGALVVEASFQAYNSEETITFKADPALSGGHLLSVKREGSTLSFTFVPDGGVTKVEAVIEIDCATLPEALKVSFDVASPAAGATIAINALE